MQKITLDSKLENKIWGIAITLCLYNIEAEDGTSLASFREIYSVGLQSGNAG